MSDPDSQPVQSLVEPLTRREREILAFLAQGHSAPEIAEKLTLAVSSVKWHIQQLYGKLGVNSRQKALARAAELGLLNPASVGSLLGNAAPKAAPTSQTSPDVAASPAPRHNLPVQVNQFFGREGEIGQLKQRLADHRLVTLTGSGGVGKTRLSLRVAEELVDNFPDGVWLVELAPLTDAALVPQQVAAVLGLRDTPGQSMVVTLTNYLRGRRALLVLDNCEHLLEACAAMADALLRAAPRLKILASSREPLGVPGEAVFPIPQLAFPQPGQVVTPEGIGQYAAVQLLLDRARLVLPDYQPAARDAAPLAYIVQRLDGIPLAIEMAAARLNILSAEQLAGRLDDVFRVLTGGSRTALPRQQTLRATLDWSYKLLSEQERLLLRRLAVFAGGCTLEAAEAVCAGDGLKADEVLELLGSLVAKSMVIAVRPAGQSVRYHLLETVRQYAREKLTDTGEGAGLRARHRDYFLGQTMAARQSHGPAAEREWNARLGVELDNLRLALEWSLSDETNIEAAPRLALATSFRFPTYQETTDWIKKVLAWCDAHPQLAPTLRIEVLTWLMGPLAQDDPQRFLDGLTEAVAIGRGLGLAGRWQLSVALFILASQYQAAYRDAEIALPLIQEAEALVRELEADPAAPYMLEMRWAYVASLKAEIANDQGRYGEAAAYADEAIRLFKAGEREEESGNALITRAAARRRLGDRALAREDLVLALKFSRNEGYYRGGPEAYITRWLAETDLLLGNVELAREEALTSLRMASEIPDYNIVASSLALAAVIAAKQGEPLRAATLAGAAQAMYARQKRKAWEDSSLDTLLPGWREGPEQVALSQAFEAGQAMTNEQAVALARKGQTRKVFETLRVLHRP